MPASTNEVRQKDLKHLKNEYYSHAEKYYPNSERVLATFRLAMPLSHVIVSKNLLYRLKRNAGNPLIYRRLVGRRRFIDGYFIPVVSTTPGRGGRMGDRATYSGIN